MSARSDAPSLSTEVYAGFGTFFTLSYVLVLNPILLKQTGINISAAFFATVVSAGLATLVMGVWVRLPFAIAPAPSITTFFASYVCLTLGLAWQTALAAVILSGFLSMLMAFLTVRKRLIDSTPSGLKVGILFAIGGFLFANGLVQAKIIQFVGGVLTIRPGDTWRTGLPILLAGLGITVLFRQKWMRFVGAPLAGILVAAIVAGFLGVRSKVEASLGREMFSAMFAADFSALADWRLISSVFVFFIIDFFGGLGKFIGLFGAMEGGDFEVRQSEKMGRALYVDGAANILGGVLGASSLAVFISSAVGIKMGGRTGRPAIVCALLIFASLIAFPLVGAIPTEATAGTLIFIGVVLIPWRSIFAKSLDLNIFDYIIFSISAVISFATFGLDKALLVLFGFYAFRAARKGISTETVFLGGATFFLAAAVIAELFLGG
jgi:AGZA family xanthine/uracil permease-like MFS transporter